MDTLAAWARYMRVDGTGGDAQEHEVVALHYVEEGLMNVEVGREGGTFGDDIAMQMLATELGRALYVVQAHEGVLGEDGEEGALFFLGHEPIALGGAEQPGAGPGKPPLFLLMKGSDWCGAGADHFEPIFAERLEHAPAGKPFVDLDE